MEENEGQDSFCFVKTANGNLRVKIFLSANNADNTVAYVKTLACSKWGIDLPGVYTLNKDENIWHDFCLVPRDPVHEFCLVPHKGLGKIEYTKFKVVNPVNRPLSPVRELSRPTARALYDKLADKLESCASLSPFEEVYVTEETIIITLYTQEKNAVEDVLRIFKPKPRQINYSDTNKVVLFF